MTMGTVLITCSLIVHAQSAPGGSTDCTICQADDELADDMKILFIQASLSSMKGSNISTEKKEGLLSLPLAASLQILDQAPVLAQLEDSTIFQELQGSLYTPADLKEYQKELMAAHLTECSTPQNETSITKENMRAEANNFSTRLGRVGPLKHIFYINLDKSLERRDHIEMQLSSQNISYSRFPAVNSTTVHDYGLIKKPWCDQGKGIIKKASSGIVVYAIAESHLQIYKKIVREDPNGTDPYLILEDDATLPAGWYDELNAKLQRVPSNAHVVVAGSWGNADCRDRADEGVFLTSKPTVYCGWHTDNLYTEDDLVFFYTGSTATVVWPKTLPLVIQEIEGQTYACHADVNLVSRNALRSYSLMPAPITVTPFDSSRTPD